AWLNLVLLIWAAHRLKFERPALNANRLLLLLAIGIVLGLAFYAGARFASPYLGISHFREEMLLLAVLVAGTTLYAALILTFIGRTWLGSLLQDAATASIEKSTDDGRI